MIHGRGIAGGERNRKLFNRFREFTIVNKKREKLVRIKLPGVSVHINKDLRSIGIVIIRIDDGSLNWCKDQSTQTKSRGNNTNNCRPIFRKPLK